MKVRIVTEGIDIQYCLTEQMLVDFFTKPLQGALFKLFKCVIMGLDHIKSLWHLESDPTEEHVEKDISLVQYEKVPQAQDRTRPKVTFRPNIHPGKNHFSSIVRGNATAQKDDQ